MRLNHNNDGKYPGKIESEDRLGYSTILFENEKECKELNFVSGKFSIKKPFSYILSRKFSFLYLIAIALAWIGSSNAATIKNTEAVETTLLELISNPAVPVVQPVQATTPPSSGSQSTVKVQKICYTNTPCGWAVYIPYTRRVDYFIKNTCVCPSDKQCIKSDDDLSVSAYVYRCADKTSSSSDLEATTSPYFYS